MANLVMGAMSSIIPKLYQLLRKEHKLQAGVKERISSLAKELESAQAVLHKVAQVPWDQLDEQVQIWARQVREASYDMEDILDSFLVRVQGADSAEQESLLKRLGEKMTNFWQKIRVRCKISGDVEDIMTHLQEVTERCRRYKVDDIVARPATVSTIDPRLHAMYTHVSKLVGIDESSSELMSKLQLDDMPNMKIKTVSIVGIGGLGKTTLAKAVYDKLRGDFNCRAFVSVGKNPDLQKVLQMVLVALDKERYQKFNFALLQDITQFIDELREFLHDNKRYLIVIDDIWEKRSWEALKLAVVDDQNCEGRIILTTRKLDVAKNADEVYELPALPPNSSKKLFYSRIYGDERKYVDYGPDEVSDEILKKCAGIPLAIITMASLLVDEPRDTWFEVYKSIGFGCKEEEAENTMKKILSFSYYDLPSHLSTCLLYLSAFPEDSVISKFSLIWMWVAEGFVQKQNGKSLFESGEGYFNDLINRCLIQEVGPSYHPIDLIGNSIFFHGCRVHDMVLDFIRSMSCEENFFTVFDNNDQGTLVRSNVVRRLAHHNKAIMELSNQANMFEMSKVRSFIALDWKVDDTWAPLSSFKLLRVLNIGEYYYYNGIDSILRVEPLGQLLHLRFLGIYSRMIEKIPKEIEDLKMLQTLDLNGSWILEAPSYIRLPTQLLCLHIFINSVNDSDTEMFSVGRMTSLEVLSIQLTVQNQSKARRQLVKELGNLRELRVLEVIIPLEDEEMLRDLIESVCNLHKIQRLFICGPDSPVFDRRQEMEFVLPGDLRRLVFECFVLWKLPSCIDPLCHRKLSHLELSLKYMDEQELKTLGRLQELRFLELKLQQSSPTIRNINDSDACYFPKLRCLILRSSMVLFVANKDDKQSVSFHIWNAKVDDRITEPRSVSDSELQSDDELQGNDEFLLLSVSDDVPPASDQENKEGSISIIEGGGEHPTTPRFMPSLQELRFDVFGRAVHDPRYCNNIGLQFLSSLQEISVNIDWFLEPLPCK